MPGKKTIKTTKNLVLSGMFIALGLLLPFLTGQIPSIGSKLLPMHLPVLICGFVCGWPYGIIVGLITPVFRSLIFGMPPMFPTAIAMAAELAVYGAATGLLYKLLPKKNIMIYVSLVAAMICGRIVWGAVSAVLYTFGSTPFTFKLFLGGAFVNALPGIIVQIVVIPPIIMALRKSKLID